MQEINYGYWIVNGVLIDLETNNQTMGVPTGTVIEEFPDLASLEAEHKRRYPGAFRDTGTGPEPQ
tara:strand:- start:418 stop:612 length:195 start_codon:yes stop_codon:yes gene_type:complete